VKNKSIAAFVLAYVLLGSVYSVTPTFADNDITIIESILNDSRDRIDEKFAEFGVNEIPQDANSLYNEGLAEYDEAIALLNSGDFENAEEHGLKALSLFEDAYKALPEAEEELVVEQEGYVGDPLAIAESIFQLQSEADEIRNLISINDLDIGLGDLYATILSADADFRLGNFAEALTLIESAEAILDKILEQIEYKAEEDQDKRVQEFVDNLLGDLQESISTAEQLGLDDIYVGQLKDLVDGLTNYVGTSAIFEITGASSDLKDALDSVDEKTYKGKLETELVDDITGDEGGEAEFKQRGDRTELEVEIEDQTPDTTFDVQVDGDYNR